MEPKTLDAGGKQGQDSQSAGEDSFDEQKYLDELYAKDDEKKEAAAEGKGGTEGSDRGQGAGSPGANAGAEVGSGKEKSIELDDEDEKLLSEWGIDKKEVTPGVKAALTRQRDMTKRVRDAESKSEMFGKNSAELSKQYQSLKKSNKELMERLAGDPNNIAEFTEKLFTAEELEKLPQGTRDILADKDAGMAFILLMQRMEKLRQEQAGEGGEETAPGAGTGTGEPEAGSGALDNGNPSFTPEQKKAYDAWVDEQMTAQGFGNYREMYAEPDWLGYVKPVIDAEIKAHEAMYTASGIAIPDAVKANRGLLSPTFQKLARQNPFEHAEVLRGFQAYKAAKGKTATEESERNARGGAFDGHGESKPKPKVAGKSLSELTDKEIEELPYPEFDRLQKDKSSKTTFFG